MDRPNNSTASTTSPQLVALQRALHQIPGISSALVIGNGTPTEIHLVTDSDRTPKRFVRDVQSLTAAMFGMRIDHRIVSVVQLGADPTLREQGRPVIEKVSMGSRQGLQWVEVSLRWPGGEITEGAAASTTSRDSRALAACTAVLGCLGPVLEATRLDVAVDHVVMQEIGSDEWVLVQASMFQDGLPTSLLGSAKVEDDVVTAGTKALLDAVNRKLFPS